MQPKIPPEQIAEFDQLKAKALEELRDAKSFYLLVFDDDNTKRMQGVQKKDLRRMAEAMNAHLTEAIDQMNPVQIFMFVTQLREDMGL